jgi:hypothetical protein
MFEDTGRRRFLQLAGTGTALSVAGCSALSNHEGDVEPATVTLQVRPDQESLQELQSEIRSRVESGEISRMEAQSEFRSGQQELATRAVEEFRNQTENNESLSVSVDDAVAEVGAVLVSGDPAALVETLSFEAVAGMFPAEAFEQAQQAGAGGAGGGAGGGAAGSGTSTPTG